MDDFLLDIDEAGNLSCNHNGAQIYTDKVDDTEFRLWYRLKYIKAKSLLMNILFLEGNTDEFNPHFVTDIDTEVNGHT